MRHFLLVQIFLFFKKARIELFFGESGGDCVIKDCSCLFFFISSRSVRQDWVDRGVPRIERGEGVGEEEGVYET
jgi:hypothetical protein